MLAAGAISIQARHVVAQQRGVIVSIGGSIWWFMSCTVCLCWQGWLVSFDV
jgi:hypothetical protein